MLPRIFKGIYNFSVYAIGVLVLIAAVLVTLVRLVLPDIGIYRGEVEAWVSSYMGYPVVIHRLDATWEGWVPYLELTDIDLLNRAGTQPITHFGAAQIRIAPLETVLKRRIVPKQLTINGFELAIARLSNGAIYIEGVNMTEVQATGLRNNELAEWLFRQEQIRIENASIEWIDIQHEQDPIRLSDVTLMLRSDGNRLQAEGSTSLPEQYGKTMDFFFDAHGDLLSTEWSGELYLSARNINPDNWYKNYRPFNLNVSGGNANIEVWSTWEKARLAGVDGSLEYSDFGASSGDSKLQIDELAYSFSGEPVNDKGWQFSVNLDRLQTMHGDWPETSIMLSVEPATNSKAYRYTSSFDYIKLDDFSPFIHNLKFLPEQVKDRLANFSITGNLRHGKLIYDPDLAPRQRMQFDMELEDIETHFGDEMPSLSNLSGHLYGYLDNGVISLDTMDTTLDVKLMDTNPVQLERLVGDVFWHRDENGWRLETPTLELQSPDVSLSLSGRVEKQVDDASPFIDILAQADESNLESLPAYLPYTSRFKFRDWMKRSVLGGTLLSASALFRGRTSDFPFDENSGSFEIIANTSGVTLDYSKLWPPVDNLDAEIIIDGRELTANIGHGEIFNATITGGVASFADIMKKKKFMALDGHVRGETRDLSLFIEQSPLQKDPGLKEIGRSLESGSMGLDLDLHIPLKQPGVKPDIAGNMTLNDGVLVSKLKGLKIEEVSGKVAFTGHSVTSETLSGSFYDRPVSLSIAGSKLDRENPPAINIVGIADKDFVADRLLEYFPATASLEHYFRNRLSGESEWVVTMTNLPPVDGRSGVKRLEIASDLNGMEVIFPAPVGKPAYIYQPLKITSYLGLEKPGNVHIEYGDSIHSELVMSAGKKLSAINMHLGREQVPENSEPGIHISGEVNSLVAQKWWDVIKEKPETAKKGQKSVIDSGVDIDLFATNLELLNHLFENTSISLNKTTDSWDFQLQGEKIGGSVRVPSRENPNREISFALDRLVMNKDQRQSSGSSGEKLDPSQILPIAGSVQDFTFNEYELGEMNLHTSPAIDGLVVDEITFARPGLKIVGAGKWNGSTEIDNCVFDIDLEAGEMETMLTTFNYEQTPVKKGETTITLNANWQGSPMDFSLDKMNGSLDMKIKKGQLLDVNPSAGRLFGLFSLATLSRRLTLDFSDIFGKGMAFDKIEGSFDIEDGHAYTNDLYMLGPSANVAISGRTGLSDQDYDQVVTVTPQLSDNLPVAGVLLGPVGIGVGAVLYLAGKMFDSVGGGGLDGILSFQYTITGSWTEPVIEKIKKNSTEQKLSEAAG